MNDSIHEIMASNEYAQSIANFPFAVCVLADSGTALNEVESFLVRSQQFKLIVRSIQHIGKTQNY